MNLSAVRFVSSASDTFPQKRFKRLPLTDDNIPHETSHSHLLSLLLSKNGFRSFGGLVLISLRTETSPT
ncbi:MAG TPA: hypothetical protein DCM07_18405 [Planctomycetaceae bacterium]|nr:hypothetical protein [Planctomycetaceae bacterium]